MQFQHFIRILRDSWWIILASLFITTGVGLAYSYTQSPIYEVTATFVVNPGVRIADTYDLLYSIDTLAGRTSLATTYANILQSQTVAEQAARSLGIPPATLEDYKINAVVLPESSVLLLQVQGPSPTLAADLANTIGTAGLDYISGLQEIYELRRLDLATVTPNTTPISPDHPTNIALSAMIGIMGGLGFVILRQGLRQSFGPNQPFIQSPISNLDPKDTPGVTSKVSA